MMLTGILDAFKYDEKGCNPVSRAPQASNKAEMSNLLPELFKVSFGGGE